MTWKTLYKKKMALCDFLTVLDHLGFELGYSPVFYLSKIKWQNVFKKKQLPK